MLGLESRQRNVGADAYDSSDWLLVAERIEGGAVASERDHASVGEREHRRMH